MHVTLRLTSPSFLVTESQVKFRFLESRAGVQLLSFEACPIDIGMKTNGSILVRTSNSSAQDD